MCRNYINIKTMLQSITTSFNVVNLESDTATTNDCCVITEIKNNTLVLETKTTITILGLLSIAL